MSIRYLRPMSILAILLLISVLVACAPVSQQSATEGTGGSDPKAEQEDSIPKASVWLSKWQAEKPRTGGILIKGQGNTAPSLDTIAEGTIGTHMISMLSYNTLLEYQYDVSDEVGFPSKIVPALAEKWEQSKDGMTYTFNLRKGVKWHDGKEFTSADAAYSIQRIMEPPPKMPSLRQGWYKGVVDKIETPDVYTLVTRLSDVDAAFIQKIAAGYTPMVPKHVLEPFNSRIGTTDADKVVGTGPFKLVKAERDIGYELRKNENYWKQGQPYLDGINIQLILEEATRVAAFKSGRLDDLTDGMPTGRIARDQLLKEISDQVNVYQWRSVSGLGNGMLFNTAKKPYSDIKVRKAVMMGIDWRGVEKVALENDSCVGSFMPPGGGWGMSCEDVAKLRGYRTPTAEDKAEAKKLLAEAGYGSGFETTVLTGYSSNLDRISQLIQPMLAEIGIKVNLRNLERTAYYSAMTNGDFEMNSMGAIASLNDPNDHIATWIICSGGRNYGKFCDPKVEDMFRQMSREPNPEKRKQMFRDLDQYLLDQVPMVNTHAGGNGANRKYVKGFIPMGGRHSQMLWETVWLDK